jgi:hypothetical protein
LQALAATLPRTPGLDKDISKSDESWIANPVCGEFKVKPLPVYPKFGVQRTHLLICAKYSDIRVGWKRALTDLTMGHT